MAYFSNSTEGATLDTQCGQCQVANDAACPILFVQMEYNYEQLDEGNETLRECMNLLIDEDGNCRMKPIIDNQLADPNQGSLEI